MAFSKRSYLLALTAFAGMFFASSPGITSGGEGGAPPAAPGGASGGSGSGSVGTGPGGASSERGSGAPPSENIAQLRAAYDALKSEHAPWKELGASIDDVRTAYGSFGRIYETAMGIGTQLGFPEDEILEALSESPIETLDYLRRQAAQGQGQGQGQGGDAALPKTREELMDLINQATEQGMQPYYEQQNVTRTNEANAVFDRTGHSFLQEHFKKEGADVNSPEVKTEMESIKMLAREIFKWDASAIHGLKHEGKTAGVQKAFADALNFADAYYTSRSARETAKLAAPQRGARGTQRQTAPVKKAGTGSPTLDEMIDDPGLINPKYK